MVSSKPANLGEEKKKQPTLPCYCTHIAPRALIRPRWRSKGPDLTSCVAAGTLRKSRGFPRDGIALLSATARSPLAADRRETEM